MVGENANSVAVRDAQFKSILYDSNNRSLYDLTNDPLERQNLATEPGYDAVKVRHAAYLAEYADAVLPCECPDESGIRRGVIDERLPRLRRGCWSATEGGSE